MTKHISCDCKCKFSCTTWNSNQKWNNRTCQHECKNYRNCEKDYKWNPGTGNFDNIKYLNSFDDTSVIKCDEIVIVMCSINEKTNTKGTNITSTAFINCHNENVRDWYILHTVFLVIKLLLIIIFICYYCAKRNGTIQNGN